MNNQIFSIIEDNLYSDSNISRIKNSGYISHSQLYRGLYSLTGHSVKEYIRKRRLSNALALLKTSTMSLTDIALQCGYSSHQAFCRAVKQTLGLTPSEYREGDTYYFFPPFNDSRQMQAISVSSAEIPQTLCLRFYHPRITGIEDAAVNTFLKAYPAYKGRIFGRNGKQRGNRFCYELYVTSMDIDLDDFERGGVRPYFQACFASTIVPNSEQKINAAWDYLANEWLQNSMFEYTGEPHYEEYNLRNGKPTRLKLYLPIRKRGAETKITLIDNPNLTFIVAKANGYNAETAASKIVLDYLTKHHPQMPLKKFYVQKEAGAYFCGVQLKATIPFHTTSSIVQIFSTNQPNYLVLESSVMGDYDRYDDLITAFSDNNDLKINRNELFAVYDASVSFDNPKIKIYCPVKIGTK